MHFLRYILALRIFSVTLTLQLSPKLTPKEQSVVIQASFLSLHTTVASMARFLKESIPELQREVKDVKSSVVAQWTPDDATVVSTGHHLPRIRIKHKYFAASHRRICPENFHWIALGIWGSFQAKGYGAASLFDH